MSLTGWSEQLSDALGLELEVDIDPILDLARDAAHQIERPAAPLTTFLVGYAAGMRGGSIDDIADCIDIATELATQED
ncbi:MAG: molybdopterin-guanine dinucleotide biosynthesis protein MobA [Nocardioidaceae bacterium]|nr:molybdopterin-guanine dinucleotide biosynthesis protein MobA [Nocardioidaceae bacterium]